MPDAVTVMEPYQLVTDPALPTLAPALDPAEAARRVPRRLARLAGDNPIRLLGARLVRHKPGKRAIVEYEVEVDRGVRRERVRVLGKIQRGRFGNSGFRLLDQLWSAGLDSTSGHGVSVPEPLGTVAPFQMWLQRRVSGDPATDLLASPGGAPLAARIAEAAHRLHGAGVPTVKQHTLADELRVLATCLRRASERAPAHAREVRMLLEACERLASGAPEPAPTGIHRDFYADQVIVDGDHLTLVDFDLYCLGDPALDIGNFLGHLTEQGLREHGDPGALAAAEEALERRFAELAGEQVRRRVRMYAALTLARHVYLSGEVGGREHLTAAVLEVARARVAEAGGRDGG